MWQRIRRFVANLGSSLWPIPVVAVLVSAGLGLLLPHLDKPAFLHDLLARLPVLAPVIEVDASSAAQILGAISTALATILGVLFSITIVALQLASTQYSPRLLRRFRGDRVSQVVLATLLGTVTMVVVLLTGLTDEVVPRLGVLAALLLTLVCFCLVAYFLHHLAREIDAATIVRHIGEETVAVLGRLRTDAVEHRRTPEIGEALVLRADRTGYLESLDEEALIRAAPPGARLLRIEVRAGDFLFPGLPLFAVSPPQQLDEKTTRALRAAFVVAQQRALEEDVLYGVRQLVDVALKAISSDGNDVTTAVMAVNELGYVVRSFQLRSPGVEDGWRRRQRGSCVVWLPILGLDTMLRHSFDEIARAAGPQLRVSARILEVMEQIIEATRPDEAHREAYAQAGRWVQSSAHQDGATDVERAYFDERYRSLLHRAAGITLPDEEPALH